MTRSATATVAHCFGGYSLPQGLEEGEIVRLMEFDIGTFTVQRRDGRLFHVASNCIQPVPPEFFGNHRAETFLKRMRALFRSSERRAGLSISMSFKYLRFAVFGDAKYSNLSSPRCSRGARRCGGKSDRRKWLASRCSARPGHSWPKVRTSPDRAEKRW